MDPSYTQQACTAAAAHPIQIPIPIQLAWNGELAPTIGHSSPSSSALSWVAVNDTSRSNCSFHLKLGPVEAKVAPVTEPQQAHALPLGAHVLLLVSAHELPGSPWQPLCPLSSQQLHNIEFAFAPIQVAGR